MFPHRRAAVNDSAQTSAGSLSEQVRGSRERRHRGDSSVQAPFVLPVRPRGGSGRRKGAKRPGVGWGPMGLVRQKSCSEGVAKTLDGLAFCRALSENDIEVSLVVSEDARGLQPDPV
jgi:hypothetical protein